MWGKKFESGNRKAGKPWLISGFLWLSLCSSISHAGLEIVSETFYPLAKPFEYNGHLYFASPVPGLGNELVKSDGTTAGTGLFIDIAPGALDSGASPQIVYNGELYFTANNPAFGSELWKTDGTILGTDVIDKFPGSAGFNGMTNFIVYNGLLYFKGFTAANGAEIWKTDGTVAGTVMVKDILAGTSSGGFDDPEVYNGLLYFRATNGSFGVGKGQELWRTNGTEVGTILFADINSGKDSSAPSGMTSWGGFLYFACNDGIVGKELCRSDGVTAGRILDIRPGGEYHSSKPERFTMTPTHLFFDAFLGTTEEMWRVTDANFPGRVQAGLTLSPTDHVVLGNELYYQANGQVFRSNGSLDGGVGIVASNGSITSARFLAASNGRVYFSGVYFLGNSTGFELMRTDGTNAGTTIMADLAVGPTSSYPRNLVDFNNKVYFYATVGGVVRWYSFYEEPVVPLMANADDYELAEDGTLTANDPDGELTPGDSNDDGVLANDAGSGTLNVTTTGVIVATGLGGAADLAADGTFTYTPPMDVSGEDSFEYMVSNGGSPQAATVTITVNPVNDAPELVPGPSQYFPAGVSGLQSIPGWVQSVDLGPGEEGQSVADYNIIQVSDASGILNSVDIQNNGTLDLDLTGISGSAQVDFSVTDDGGTANPGDEDTSAIYTFFVSVDQAADVGVQAAQCSSVTAPGFVHPYSLTISNSGPDDTSEVLIDINLTGEIAVITTLVLPSGADCYVGANQMMCSLTTSMASGAVEYLDFQIASDEAATSDIVMTAQVTGLESDSAPANNSKTLVAKMVQDLIMAGDFESCKAPE